MNFPGIPRAPSAHNQHAEVATPGDGDAPNQGESKSTSPRDAAPSDSAAGVSSAAPAVGGIAAGSAAAALVPADHFDPWRPRASSLTSPRSSATGKRQQAGDENAVAHMIPLRAKFGRSTLSGRIRMESLATDIQRRGECLSG